MANKMQEVILEVTNQRTAFATGRGLLQAVDGVSFTLARGRTLGIVGESGSENRFCRVLSWGYCRARRSLVRAVRCA